MKLIVIHNLKIQFRVIVAIIYTKYLKKKILFVGKHTLEIDVRDFHSPADFAFGLVRFPLCRYTLVLLFVLDMDTSILRFKLIQARCDIKSPIDF